MSSADPPAGPQGDKPLSSAPASSPQPEPQVGQQVFLPKSQLDQLIALLSDQGYEVVAPVLRDGAVNLGPVSSAQEIARGIRDEQKGGHYRVQQGDPELYFQYAVGSHSPKRFLFPPVQPLFRMHIEGDEFVVDERVPESPKLALLGIRPCELAAIQVQDRVFGVADPAPAIRCESDEYYNQARRQSLLIVVNCTSPGGTCFCQSMGTGPAAIGGGFDLAMTELRDGFVATIGSARGAELAARLPVRPPTIAETELASLRIEQARQRMGRRFNPDGLVELLQAAVEDAQWSDVAQRCLGCGNCTAVCPTCFCASVVDSNDLTGAGVARTRQWDVCFTHQFSYTTAGPVRNTIRARYRHWLRHKLCTWWEQFGCSGCVGCGRCITWCPVGIDLTSEVAAIRRGRPAASLALDAQGNAGAATTATQGEEVLP